VPYFLVATVILVLMLGVAKLNGARQSHDVPWTSLVIWAVLFTGGIAVWLRAIYAH
jgi:hypothetical protein